MNAVMHSACAANTAFFRYFYSRAAHFFDEGKFSWNQRNIDGRNCLDLVNQSGEAAGIRSWCADLVLCKYMEPNDPPALLQTEHRSGGFSSTNRRNGDSHAVPGTKRFETLQSRGLLEPRQPVR